MGGARPSICGGRSTVSTRSACVRRSDGTGWLACVSDHSTTGVHLCRTDLRPPLSVSRYSDRCRRVSDTLGFIYFAMVVLLIVIFRQKVKGVMEHFGNLLPVLLGENLVLSFRR